MDETIICPCCGKYHFEEPDDGDLCPVCGWFNDSSQNEEPDYKSGMNHRSLNEHIKQWKEGTLPDYIYEIIENNKDRLPE